MITVRWRVRTLAALVLVAALGIKGVLIVQDWRVAAARRLAIARLPSGAPPSAFTESELVSALRDPYADVRDSAAWALDQNGSTCPALVRVLIEKLETETENSRFENRWSFRPQLDPATSLKRIKLSPATIAPLLSKAMASKERWVRLKATEVLCDAAGRPGPPSPVLDQLLLATLQDGEPAIRVLAPEALARLDSETRRKAVAILQEQLRQPDRFGQLLAAIGLSHLGEEGQASVTILTDRLWDGEVKGRLLDLSLLDRIGPVTTASVPAVLREMTAPDADQFVPLLQNGLFPSQNVWHVTELNRVLDKNGRLQTPPSLNGLGAAILQRGGPEAERQAVDILLGMVHGDDEPRVLRAVDVLGSFGTKASAAVPTLLDLTERSTFVWSGKNGEGDVFRLMRALEQICADDDPRFVATLIRMLKSRDGIKRWGAAGTLSHLEPPHPSAVPVLIEALKDSLGGVRRFAADALGRYEGPVRKTTLPALIDALRDEHPGVRCDAARSLARLRAGAPQAVPVLVKQLHDENPNLRRQAAEILGAFGPDAASAVPELMDARQDAVKKVRDAAQKALKTIATPDAAIPIE